MVTCYRCGRQDFLTTEDMLDHLDSSMKEVTEEELFKRYVRQLKQRIADGASEPITATTCFQSHQRYFATRPSFQQQQEKTMLQLLCPFPLTLGDSGMLLSMDDTEAVFLVLKKCFSKLDYPVEALCLDATAAPSPLCRVVLEVMRKCGDAEFVPFLLSIANDEIPEDLSAAVCAVGKLVSEKVEELTGWDDELDPDTKAEMIEQALPYRRCAKLNAWFPLEDMISFLPDDKNNRVTWSKFALHEFTKDLLKRGDQVYSAFATLRSVEVGDDNDANRIISDVTKDTTASDFFATYGYFLCPNNLHHQRPFWCRLDGAGDEGDSGTSQRRPIRCTECDVQWCSHCAQIDHPRQPDCSMAATAHRITDDESQQVRIKKVCSDLLQSFEEGRQHFLDQVAALQDNNDFELTKQNKITELTNVVAKLQEYKDQNAAALNQAQEYDALQVAKGAARCPNCGRQPQIHSGSGCDYLNCGRHAHSDVNAFGGCNFWFNKNTHKYRPSEHRELKGAIANAEMLLAQTERTLAAVRAMTQGAPPNVEVPQAMKLWPGLKCSACGEDFEGPFRLECINCSDLVSICMKCVSVRDKHCDVGLSKDGTVHRSNVHTNQVINRPHAWTRLFEGQMTEVQGLPS